MTDEIEVSDEQALNIVARAKTRAAAGYLDEAKQILEASLGSLGDRSILHEQLGLILGQEGAYDAAVRHLRRAVELEPSAIECRLALLRAAVHADDRAAAAEIAAEASAAAPRDTRVLTLAAKAFRRNRNFDKAGELWQQVARQSPTDYKAFVEAADAYMRCKDFKSALACAVEGTKRDPKSEAAKIIRLQALEKTKVGPVQLGAAVRDLGSINATAAMEYVPALIAGGLYDVIADLVGYSRHQGAVVDPILLSSLAKTMQRVALHAESEQRYEAAARYWQSLVSISDANREAVNGLRNALASLSRQARSAVQAGEYDRAARLFRSLVSIDGSHARARRDLGSALEKCELWVEAAETWLRCAEDLADDERLAAAIRAGKAARKLDKPEDQLAILVKARNLYPDDSEIQDWGDRAADKIVRVIAVAIEADALDEASRLIEHFKQWNEQHPKLLGMSRRFVRAVKLSMQDAERRGDGQEAARFAELLLSVEPTRVSALKLIARNAFRERRFEEATELYGRLITLDPGDERYYAKLGRAFKALRKYDQGIPVVMRLLEIHPDHPQGRQLLSEMLHGQEMQHA